MRKLVYKIVLIGILFLTFYLFYYGYNYRKEIQNSGKETIGKFIYYRRYPKTKTYYFKYFVDGKAYINSSGIESELFQKDIGKFYSLKYSKKDPNKIIIDITRAIQDSVEIQNAGFTVK